MAQTHARVAMLAGASGLVGQEILAILLSDERTAHVHTWGRRALPRTHPRLTQHPLPAGSAPWPRIDEAYIALGTTIRVAGSQAAFQAVDLDLVLQFARAAQAAGATRLGVVSALGASSQSAVFYNRVKGDMEAAVQALGIACTVFARPSLLMGQRSALGQPERPGERLGAAAMRWLKPLIPLRWQAIAAADVAAALVHAVRNGPDGVQHLESSAMQGAALR